MVWNEEKKMKCFNGLELNFVKYQLFIEVIKNYYLVLDFQYINNLKKYLLF